MFSRKVYNNIAKLQTCIFVAYKNTPSTGLYFILSKKEIAWKECKILCPLRVSDVALLFIFLNEVLVHLNPYHVFKLFPCLSHTWYYILIMSFWPCYFDFAIKLYTH